MRDLFIFFLMAATFSVEAGSLVDSYKMENDRYIFQLSYRCLDEHIKQKSNAIDPQTLLPVSVVSDAYVAMPFTLDVVIVGIQYIGNTLHHGAGMECYYDKFSGELLAFSSYNAEKRDSDKIAKTKNLMKSGYQYPMDDIDMMFGVKLNYDEFIKRVKGLSDEEKLALTKAVKGDGGI